MITIIAQDSHVHVQTWHKLIFGDTADMEDRPTK